MIIFENPGEIDASAIATFGVSVKEGDNPIGFFGTGLKYAIAILLRNNHRITIWSGLEKIEFTAQPTTIRGEQFDVIHMNGERLGFTTQVGKTWELWMAYRELFCNARDESGEAYRASEAPEPREGHTLIAVEGRPFEAIHAERWRYFVEDEADFVLDGIEVRHRESTNYFYRGVSVSLLPRAAMLSYNDTTPLELTEDRTAKNNYELPYRIARALLSLTDEKLLRTILTAPKQWLEHHLDFHGWSQAPSPAFLKVVGQLVNDGIADVNASAKRLWQEKRPDEYKPREIALSEVQKKSLEKALDFCERIGFPIRGAYPIFAVESLGKDTLGLAKDGTIYVSERAFLMGGSKQVAATLIEEYIHLRHRYEDCTRPMQNWLFEKVVSLGEELVGEPL